MEKEFVTFEIALALKELGFSDRCLTYYNQYKELNQSDDWCCGIKTLTYTSEVCLAPLWQQVIDWLREEYGIIVELNYAGGLHPDTFEYTYQIYSNQNTQPSEKMTYVQAREQAILQAIKLIKNENIVSDFANKLVNNSIDLDSDISRIVDENFEDLI